ncbi:hypothetical protein PR202_gb10717 [Eleusine coracana subsp. coracana]|uniref:Reverse transcriptase zinc-binding domain-containing protein n=1 Tax=Eleusine coracana subsp. coracana TaxID=191504 RepID=A0AAV5EIB9_ELECO|nr:hypothetical protein PR202_gb10717 [Eleusine coracana subsp. coracana]
MATARTVLADGMRVHLVPRLTQAATEDMTKVEVALSQIVLTTDPDTRHGPLIDANNKLKTTSIYKLLVTNTPCPYVDFVWRNSTPPKVQFFIWLLSQDRIKSRANLHTKKIVEDTTCELCGQHAEDSDHLIFRCATASALWAGLGIDTQNAYVDRLWELQRPSTIPAQHFEFFIHLCCWQVWKHRNEVISTLKRARFYDCFDTVKKTPCYGAADFPDVMITSLNFSGFTAWLHQSVSRSHEEAGDEGSFPLDVAAARRTGQSSRTRHGMQSSPTAREMKKPSRVMEEAEAVTGKVARLRFRPVSSPSSPLARPPPPDADLSPASRKRKPQGALKSRSNTGFRSLGAGFTVSVRRSGDCAPWPGSTGRVGDWRIERVAMLYLEMANPGVIRGIAGLLESLLVG